MGNLRFVFITMDGGHNAALREAATMLKRDYDITMHLDLHSMSSLHGESAWQKLEQDVAQADFVFGCMIFGEDHVRPMERIMKAADVPRLFITSNPALIYTSHIGNLELKPADDTEDQSLMMRWMQKLRPKKKGRSEGYRQTALIKNLTKIMKYVPGKVRDLHTFIASHDYWLHSSPENLERLMCLFINRYVPGYEKTVPVLEAIQYPDAAIYHPDAPAPFPDAASYQQWRKQRGTPIGGWQGVAGLLIHRAVILSGNTDHLDTLIRNLEAQGIEARTTYSAFLDFRPSMQQFMVKNGHGMPPVDAVVNGMGFPLVGGPAGSRPDEAVTALSGLDVGYFDMVPLGFQRVEDWQGDEVGLNPMQVAMNIALPELDGISEPVIYGGPTRTSDKFVALQPELKNAAKRISRRVRLRNKTNADKKLAVVLFNFPPNLGNAGTAAFLDVFASLHRLLLELKEQGYTVDVPADAESLRHQVVDGNAIAHGTDSNVAYRLPVDQYRELFPWYPEIEQYWGYAPGELLTDGKDFFILGKQFGNVFVAIQPSFGYERDPMRLLMGKDAAPHHGFAAFYAWLNHIYDADAVVHFGTHGALEFMPGKQAGISADCWPTRLLGELPNFYYYCVNNPSEGSIAKRRSAATLVSYMVPPLQQAGLYKGLRRLKDSIEQFQKHTDARLLEDIRTQAERLDLVIDVPEDDYIPALNHELMQVEHRMIPLGLHVLGQAPSQQELANMLSLVVMFNAIQHPKGDEDRLPPLPILIARNLGWNYTSIQETLKTNPQSQDQWERIETLVNQAVVMFIDAPRSPQLDTQVMDIYLQEQAKIPVGLLVNLWSWLDNLMTRLIHDEELSGLIHALNGGYILPSPGNDVMRNEHIVPTGRNIHALDPYRIPTPISVFAARKIVKKMLERLTEEQGALPETVAMILWGTDNLKSDGEGIAQCLELVGAQAIEDELGNISDVRLIPLNELGRPRIDVVMTVSGIFRDLFHHQAGLLDKAMRLAAQADEPVEANFIRKHSLAHAKALGISLDEAAARVYCNAPGSYGANVNHLVESSTWETDDQLSDVFVSRKSFVYSPGGQWKGSPELMKQTLATVDAAFQNIDSFELGISDVDHYYEYLGGVTKTVEKLSGKRPPVMVGDAISTTERLSSLEQMVRLESRAKLLNPKWYDAMLSHGYEGVREIEHRVSNTFGWSATTDSVEGWVYNDIADTFLLDEAMRQKMAQANPHATAAIAQRLLEADARGMWDATDDMVDRLREIYGNLEDQLEGVQVGQ